MIGDRDVGCCSPNLGHSRNPRAIYLTNRAFKLLSQAGEKFNRNRHGGFQVTSCIIPNPNAHMVDVGDKSVTHRVAIAGGLIRMLPETFEMVCAGTHKKGDVLGIARIAGIMAAKKTSDLIPLCHPIGLTRVTVEFSPNAADNSVYCQVQAETRSQTGVEMEALVGLQTALATIYDMCKAVDRGMQIDQVKLLEKRGGKSGHFIAD